ncbi:MAG: tol-pal system protein YbgF [Alphaproteobacteria bacterium]|nr:tol-pal system protein YbgF [Alphaproteobacteria bacterium]MDP6874765.1 tol-pal system protein YbgF [Alphaproteobacteria bacterium]
MQRKRRTSNPAWSRALSSALFAGVCSVLLLAPPMPARAQNADLQTLTQRIERLQRDLSELQKDYYRGEKKRAPGADQANTAAGNRSGGQLANAEIRMSNLESEMRLLTGQLEEVRHGIQTVLGRLDSLVKDVDFRLTEIERRMAAAPAAGATGASTAKTEEGEATSDENGATPAAAAVQPSGPPSVLPKGSPMERYNYAYSLLIKVRLDEAEAAFQEFISEHGDDDLAGNAQYWLGETFYARNKLSEAARTFLTGIQRYPDSSKAPDTMLKLGITLGKMGQKEEACAAFLEMTKLFPNLRVQVKKRLQREIRTGGCG